MSELRIVSRPNVQQELARLRTKGLSFDLEADGPFMPSNDWRIDRYRQALPRETSGPPVPGGSWEIARALSESYGFVDPGLVHAFYDPQEPLAGRTMLLEVHFWGLRIYAGVRVGAADDSTRDVDGRRVRVASWNYRTLEGHFEAGQIDYEVWKWLDSGEVEFRIEAFSRPAPTDHPVVTAGFKLFGRRTQVRFARRACERIAALTADALQKDRRTVFNDTPPEVKED